MALGTALKAFFATLTNRQIAERVRQVLLEGVDETPKLPDNKKTTSPPSPATQKPVRSDAVALLATLQREARLIDLIQEKLGQYSDAQVGAAARPCLVQCAATLDRVLGLHPVVDGTEGQTVDIPDDPSSARYQWVGEGTGSTGKLIHQGWQASRIELPQWTGSDQDTRVVAAAQIER